MRSSFNLQAISLRGLSSNARLWLQIAVSLLAILNLVALFLYFDPPGGSRESLLSESVGLRSAITTARMQNSRLKTISTKVQLGGQQAIDFENRYILPKRLAYESVLAEIQHMAQTANLTERDGQWTEEPIDGTADLSVLTNSVNFEGSYSNLMHFLYEVDRSPMLLMLDTLTATPQKAGQIAAQVRFQTIIRDEPQPVRAGGGQP